MKVRINEPRSVQAGGVSIDVSGDVIEHDFDADLAAGPATAIRDAIVAGIRAVSAGVAPATLVYREKAKRALARGARWAVERYGGRTPGSSSRLFNDSGDLAAGIAVARASDGAYQVTAPADRLDLPGAPPGAMLDRLRALVPALAAPLEQPLVRAAIEATLAKLITLAR